MPDQGKIRVLIVEDIDETRDNLAKLLSFEPDIEIVGAASNGQEAIAIAKRERPSVILMDICMPGMDGITATEIITNTVPESPIIMMSVQGEQDYLRRSMLAGAREFLVKGRTTADELVSAIRCVHELEKARRLKYALGQQHPATAGAASSGGGTASSSMTPTQGQPDRHPWARANAQQQDPVIGRKKEIERVQNEYPDVLTSFLKRLPNEDGDLQFAMGLTKSATPASVATLSLAVQNPFDSALKYSVTLELNGWSRPLLFPKGVAHTLGPGQSGILTIPIWVRENAKVAGQYEFKCNLHSRRADSRVERRRVHDGIRPPDRDWAGTVAKNVFGLGLLAAVGVGFVSIPRKGYYQLLLPIGAGSSLGDAPQLTYTTALDTNQLTVQFRSLWCVPGTKTAAIEAWY